MEITKKYLEQQFNKQFEAIKVYFDKALEEKLDVKLAAQTKELKEYVHDSFEVQQDYIESKYRF